MVGMFNGAAAFNQPLSSFDTSSVTYVSHICAESDLMRNQILISYSTHLVYRCPTCSGVPRPSIRTSVISETIGRTQVCLTCLLTPDALAQANRKV